MERFWQQAVHRQGHHTALAASCEATESQYRVMCCSIIVCKESGFRRVRAVWKVSGGALQVSQSE